MSRSRVQSARNRCSGKGTTVSLMLVAGELAVLFRVVGRLDKPAAPGPRRPSPGISSQTAFDKSRLNDHKSAVRVSNVQIVDFDRDGLSDILVCDAARNAVILYRQTSNGQFTERVLADNLKCPAHATVVDLDQDGDLDVVVAVLIQVHH